MSKWFSIVQSAEMFGCVSTYSRMSELASDAELFSLGCYNSKRMKITEVHSDLIWSQSNDILFMSRVTVKFKSMDDLVLFKMMRPLDPDLLRIARHE